MITSIRVWPAGGGGGGRGVGWLGDVGAVLLSTDSDGEVAETGHRAGQAVGTNGGGVLGERGVKDVVELVLDLPVAAYPGRDLVAGGRAG